MDCKKQLYIKRSKKCTPSSLTALTFWATKGCDLQCQASWGLQERSKLLKHSNSTDYHCHDGGMPVFPLYTTWVAFPCSSSLETPYVMQVHSTGHASIRTWPCLGGCSQHTKCAPCDQEELPSSVGLLECLRSGTLLFTQTEGSKPLYLGTGQGEALTPLTSPNFSDKNQITCFLRNTDSQVLPQSSWCRRPSWRAQQSKDQASLPGITAGFL